VSSYHFIVLGIIAAAIAMPAYRFPKRGFLFQFGVSLLIAAALAGLLALVVYLYFAARGEV
jgi:phosphate/sulfate permease